MISVKGKASRSWVISAISMFAVLAGCCSLRAQSQLLLVGEPMWEIRDGVCQFKFAGETALINQGPSDYLSGSMRIGLMLTANPLPDERFPISVADLGQLQGGYQFSNFSTSAPAAIPPVTGFRYFTLAIEEFTSNGWVTHFVGRSQLSYLKQGVVGPPPLWKPRTGRVIPVPVEKPAGLTVKFSQKAVQLGGKIHIVSKIDQFSLSAKLGHSGRTVVYRSAIPRGNGADWSYKSGKAKWHGKGYRVGVLVIDYGVTLGKRAKTTYWLYFQKSGRGFYKATHVGGDGSFTTWGMFTLG
jgi:hypothetical protein